jgi:cell division protein FtsI (penicillin-binding protein 3)
MTLGPAVARRRAQHASRGARAAQRDSAPVFVSPARQWLLFGTAAGRRRGADGPRGGPAAGRPRFLASQGDARFSRVATIIAHRGNITDRNGEPLAVSTPVDSVWVNPRELAGSIEQLPHLAAALGTDRRADAARQQQHGPRVPVCGARHDSPAMRSASRQLNLPGVNLAREYRRYYPAGEVTGHVLGFTSIDDVGQEGTELTFDNWLAGENGAKRVIQDSKGRKVEDVESIRPGAAGPRPRPEPGSAHPVHGVSRAQERHHRESRARRLGGGDRHRHRRSAGDGQSAGLQPERSQQMLPAAYRNRAVTDLFEPGSSVKPFIVAAALASGKFNTDSVIDTDPGFIQVGATTFEDEHNLGAIDLATVLAKSSNVGMAKLALQLEPQQIWTTLNHFGFGQVTSSGFPGESAGVFTNYSHWRAISIATLSHGYGISVTPLQLAQAYAAIGARGIRRPVSLLRMDARRRASASSTRRCAAR